jgi:hypothetical protein
VERVAIGGAENRAQLLERGAALEHGMPPVENLVRSTDQDAALYVVDRVPGMDEDRGASEALARRNLAVLVVHAEDWIGERPHAGRILRRLVRPQLIAAIRNARFDERALTPLSAGPVRIATPSLLKGVQDDAARIQLGSLVWTLAIESSPSRNSSMRRSAVPRMSSSSVVHQMRT